jgi:hypothetical protein
MRLTTWFSRSRKRWLGVLLISGLSASACSEQHSARAADASTRGRSKHTCSTKTPDSELASFGPEIEVSTQGRSGLPTYDGPVVVESSTSGVLVLQTGSLDEDADAGVAQAGALPLHVSIGFVGAPVFPVGAKLWLTLAPARDPQASRILITQPWSISLRTEEGSRLLFGAALNPSSEIPSPIPIGAITETCVEPISQACFENGTLHHSSVELLGDRPVTVAPGNTGRVTIGGFDYDVDVAAREFTGGTRSSANCNPDAAFPEGVWVFVRAADMDALIASLPVGPAPACSIVSDPGFYVSLTLSLPLENATYEGPAFYRERTPNQNNCWRFDVPGLHTAGGNSAATLLVCGDPDLLAGATPDQEFWLSMPAAGFRAMHEANRGPLLFAELSPIAPIRPEGSTLLEQALGIRVDAESRCAYADAQGRMVAGADSVIELWDLVFATTPPTRVECGATATLAFDGHDYRVSSSPTPGNELIFSIRRQ